MRVFLILFLFLNLSYSAYLYKQKNRCIDSYYFDQNTQTVYYNYSHNPGTFYSTTKTANDFIPGYEYNSTTGICSIPQNAQLLGLESSQYHFLIALIGVFVGFTFLFFSAYLSILIARK